MTTLGGHAEKNEKMPFKMLLAVNQSLLDADGKPTKMKPGKVRARSFARARAPALRNDESVLRRRWPPNAVTRASARTSAR